ncbi:hypothetical protein [Pandoravirus japonicus]|uniref:Uncharacterized protein n=1 Tax=Pandoravirus japonicus TaxID=2823154 RepID=A0A811BSU8_9VIRU|nr:hypothetical protein [Pandoravirus japonicus]
MVRGPRTVRPRRASLAGAARRVPRGAQTVPLSSRAVCSRWGQRPRVSVDHLNGVGVGRQRRGRNGRRHHWPMC